MSKPKKGRPPKPETLLEPITIRLPEPMMRQIEARMAKRLDAPDKSTMIRELIAKALSDGQ
jgi:Ribbon-helix-helix protein, copG family